MTKKTLGIILLGADSAAKVERRLAGKSLLELVVRRITDCQRLDGAVVVAQAPEQAEWARQLVPPDVPTFVAPPGDALTRILAAAEAEQADALVRVRADNPYVDPLLVDRLVITAEAHPSCDYISYSRADGRPAILSQLGVCAEWCSVAALRRAATVARRSADRQDVTAYLYGHPELFSVRLIPLPRELDRDDLRLRVDHEEDWEHAQQIYEALGADEWDWRRVADLLDHQPHLRKRMAMLNRATQSV